MKHKEREGEKGRGRERDKLNFGLMLISFEMSLKFNRKGKTS
jgi:hypothetical protein